MRSYVLFILYVIAFTKASKSRNVNLALETVLEFNGKDDVEFINNMQNFLDKIKKTILRNQGSDKFDFKSTENYGENYDIIAKKKFQFTEFLSDTISILKSYTDDDLRKFFITLNKEIEGWQSKNKYFEITNHLGFRRLINDKLHNLQYSPPDEIRKKLNNLSKNLYVNKRTGNNGFVADFLDYFYRKESQQKFSEFLNNLKLYRTRNRRSGILDLKKILRNGLRAVVEPIFNTDFMQQINTIYSKYVINDSDAERVDTLLNKIKNKIVQIPEIIQDNFHMIQKGFQENEILDYIEDHKKIIEKHLTYGSPMNAGGGLRTKRYKSNTLNKYSQTTTGNSKKRKTKPKYSSFKGSSKIHETKNKKYQRMKTSTNRDEFDEISDDSSSIGTKSVKEPILIKIESGDESGLKDMDDVARTRRTKKRRFKKSTRRNTKKSFFSAITKKQARKAFRTTYATDRGLSIEHIEHFGNLLNVKRRKILRNDTQTEAKSVTGVITGSSNNELNGLSGEREKHNVQEHVIDREERKLENATRGGIEVSSDSRKHNTPDHVQNENASIFDASVKSNYDSIKKENNIPMGDIVLEKPNTVVITVPKNTAKRVFSDDQVKTTKFIATTQEATTISISNIIRTTARTVRDAEKVSTTMNNEVENEVESETDKFNTTDKYKMSSSIPAEVYNFLKESENDVDEGNSKVQNQMKADLAKLLAPPTTSSVATNLFTDPFKDIDDAVDLI